LKKCLNRKRQVSSSPPTSLKCSPPGGGDVSQDGPGGPLYQPKPAIKNSLRKSSRNYARALLILTVFGCISGYHVDALPIEKHDTLIKCGLPELNMNRRWNGSDGKEYNFLKSYHESGNLKQRNEKKQNWINNIDTCKSPPNSNNCDLEGEELVKSVQRWLKYFFNSNQRAELVRKEVNNIVNEVGNLLLESSKLDHKMKEAWEEKKERCDQKFNVENDNNNIEATTTTTTTTEPNLNGGSYTFNANSMLLLISMIVLHALNEF